MRRGAAGNETTLIELDAMIRVYKEAASRQRMRCNRLWLSGISYAGGGCWLETWAEWLPKSVPREQTKEFLPVLHCDSVGRF